MKRGSYFCKVNKCWKSVKLIYKQKAVKLWMCGYFLNEICDIEWNTWYRRNKTSLFYPPPPTANAGLPHDDVPGEFPAQRPVTRRFDVFCDLHPNKRLSKQWWGWLSETPSCPLWRHRNVKVLCLNFGTSKTHLTIIGSDDGPISGRHEDIIWTNAGL